MAGLSNEPPRERKTYALAPDDPVGASGPAACTTQLTPDKREAVKAYLNTLGPALRAKYGRGPHYTPAQVRETALERALSIDYVCWAFLLYCSPGDFGLIHAAADAMCDAAAMRGVVAEAFFGGNTAFDACELAGVIASGAAEAGSAGASSLVGWLADVDWSVLVDWW